MNEVILMYSCNYKRDMWWIVSGDNYIGPYLKRHQADRELLELNKL